MRRDREVKTLAYQADIGKEVLDFLEYNLTSSR